MAATLSRALGTRLCHRASNGNRNSSTAMMAETGYPGTPMAGTCRPPAVTVPNMAGLPGMRETPWTNTSPLPRMALAV